MTDIDNARDLFFSGYRQGNRHTISESSYGNMSAHKKIQLKAQNYELAVSRIMHPQMEGMHNEEVITNKYQNYEAVDDGNTGKTNNKKNTEGSRVSTST